ncbi:D-hexose-6-phosphate mutarotase [Moritella marina ATCC 15381]|uniref:Putative glucose-6-phosphate 1-epimerase n=1 Tax=Moritella marina ATCC 15381 TaxID=1202962 RepID=A0A5J6WJR1_MORMI|nr:D-hexose-6-phosphate mutarotase [Moritella marina]QFI36632.1 D-hexose-6-phosphate mutarotase [Moritella marina ATCC 15381]
MSYRDTITDQIKLTEHIQLVTSNGLKYLHITHPKAVARISLFGAHLLSFTPANSAPVIWMSDNAIFNGVKAIRGGVPICWPWFGPANESPTVQPLAQTKDYPSHGFARNNHWQLLDTHSDNDTCTLRLQLTSSPEMKRLWPHDFNLIAEFIISESLTINLTTSNTGNTSFDYGCALHSYLQISQPDAVQVHGLDNQNPVPRVLTGDVDIICEHPASTITLEDNLFQRKLDINNEGNNAMVVWNPWQVGAKAFVDMPDDGYQTMFCLEPAIIGKKAVTVAPGKSHTLTTRLSVTAL